MKTNAILLALLIFGMSLAGCVSQSDGVAEVTLTDEQIDTILDEHLDEFLENMTIVVNEDITNYNNNSGETQTREWFSTGEMFSRYWNDGQHISGIERCLEFGSSYDSDTGEYIGEECKEFGYPNEESDWNLTNCTDSGGVVEWNTAYSNPYQYPPTCIVTGQTISTNSGEALLIYEMNKVTIMTSCNGVFVGEISAIGGHYGGEDYVFISGSSMNCTHDIQYQRSYWHSGYSTDVNYQSIWSLVYVIQNVTVV